MFDTDDISIVERLWVQHNYLKKHKDIGAIGSNYNLIDEQGHLLVKIE